MKITRIAVLGMGKVGKLAGVLLEKTGMEVVGFDSQNVEGLPHEVRLANFNGDLSVDEVLQGFDAVLSCLPYHLNIPVAEAAHAAGMHYFDLTEDVSVTRKVRQLAKTSKAIMAPQCGLAPGLIGIVGAHLAQQFERVRSIKLRVGALPCHPTGLLGYAFNWSPEGVVNEYLNDCEVIEDGQRKWVSPMEWVERIYVNGTQLEAFTTSGGLGTMCETYQGVVENLDYKSMRYPGHVELMNFFFNELLMRERREDACKILTHAKPPVSDDVVYFHASAEGEEAGALQRKEFVRAFMPRELGGEMRTAIAWTTMASAVAVIEMVNNGDLPQQGFLKQESIPFESFLATRNGSLFDD